MIGELPYQPTLNSISLRIVEHATRLWSEDPKALLICESEPMRQAAERLGVPKDRLVTALPQESGHTTRKVAAWLNEHRSELPPDPWIICTHTLHSDRANRVLRKCGVIGHASPVAANFDATDRDWKLRSETAFRLYNVCAEIYCRVRGWV